MLEAKLRRQQAQGTSTGRLDLGTKHWTADRGPRKRTAAFSESLSRSASSFAAVAASRASLLLEQSAWCPFVLFLEANGFREAILPPSEGLHLRGHAPCDLPSSQSASPILTVPSGQQSAASSLTQHGPVVSLATLPAPSAPSSTALSCFMLDDRVNDGPLSCFMLVDRFNEGPSCCFMLVDRVKEGAVAWAVVLAKRASPCA